MFTTNSGRFISYYGREHTLDIQRQDGNNPTISTIDQLFNVLLNVWCKETAYPSCQKDYDYDMSIYGIPGRFEYYKNHGVKNPLKIYPDMNLSVQDWHYLCSISTELISNGYVP